MAKILYIGLGGTGREIIERIKTINIKDHDRYRYMTIDAAKADFTLAVRDVRKQVEENIRKIDSWWFPTAFRAEGDEALEGFLQKRYLGRLGFFLKAHRLIRPLTEMLQQLAVGGESLRVFVFTSAAGGAGSSFFVDLGFILKHILNSHQIQAMTMGVVIAEDVIARLYPPKPEDTQKNGVAFWSEVDYYMTPNREYSFSLLNGVDIKLEKTRVYDGIYYFGHQNRKRMAMNEKSDYWSLAAHFIAQHSNLQNIYRYQYNENGELDRVEISFENFLNTFVSADPQDRHSFNYSSGGYIRVCFPKEKVRLYLVRRFISSFLKKAVASGDEEKTKSRVEDFFDGLNLIHSSDKDQFINHVGRQQVLNKANFQRETFGEQIKQLLADVDQKTLGGKYREG